MMEPKKVKVNYENFDIKRAFNIKSVLCKEWTIQVYKQTRKLYFLFKLYI